MIVSRTLGGYAPLGLLNWGTWYVFLGFHLIDFVASLAGAPITWSATTLVVMVGVTFAVVVLVGPNVLRTFCLHFVQLNMHYYGDVELGNVIQQTQVLNPWWRCSRAGVLLQLRQHPASTTLWSRGPSTSAN